MITIAGEYYRYISHPAEIQQIQALRLIRSTNPAAMGATWLTPDRYDDPHEASRRLALSYTPTHRIGPIPFHKVPVFDIEVRTVAPLNGHPGLGRECRTMVAIWLFGVWSFDKGAWETI